MRTFIATLCLVTLFAAPASAQEQTEEIELVEPAPRQGYYLALGTGSALIGGRADDGIGDLGFFLGGGFRLRFGQMSNDWIGFGLAVHFGGGQSTDWAGGWGGLAVDIQFKPFSDLDFAIRTNVGVGGGGVGRKDETQETENDPDGVLATLYAVGISYDWFPFWDKGDSSGGFAITPYLEGQLLPGDGLIMGGVFIGVELTYWFGLPKNKLKLPVDKAFDR